MNAISHLKLLTTVLLCLSSITLFSQPENDLVMEKPVNHNAGEFVFSLSPDMITGNSMIKAAAGFKIQFFASKRISFDADLVFSKNYLHFDPGLIGVPLGLLMLSVDDEERTMNELLFSLLGIALSVEHISYHIPVNKKTDISPYVCVLRYRRTNNHELYTSDGTLVNYLKDNVCFTAGLQADKLLGRFLLAPYVEYSVSYKDMSSFFNCGVYFGYRFGKVYQR